GGVLAEHDGAVQRGRRGRRGERLVWLEPVVPAEAVIVEPQALPDLHVAEAVRLDRGERVGVPVDRVYRLFREVAIHAQRHFYPRILPLMELFDPPPGLGDAFDRQYSIGPTDVPQRGDHRVVEQAAALTRVEERVRVAAQLDLTAGA